MNLRRRFNVKVALALLSLDAVFLVVSLAHHAEHQGFLSAPWLRDRLLSAGCDEGYAEWFQYAKELTICLLFGVAAVRHRDRLFAVLSLLYAYLLLDDSLRVHERIGHELVSNLSFPRWSGELVVHLAMGTCFLVAIALAYRSSGVESRRIAGWMVALTAVLAFFGAVLDAASEAVPVRVLYLLFGQLDDAGEMVVMSIIVAFAVHAPALVPRAQRAPRGGLLAIE